MTRQHRSNVELNFDGLTDSVTNLVGSLVLLVVMVIGATSPKILGEASPPPPDNTVGAERPIDPLLERIRSMKESVFDIDQEVQRTTARIPDIEVEIEELARRAAEQLKGPSS